MKLRSRPRRALAIQHLENRCLLASDLLSHDLCVTPQPSVDHGPSMIADESPGVQAESIVFRATDAGSTPETAADIGFVDGLRRLRGRLGWFDRIDVIRFQLERDADVTMRLRRLNRDADLFLSDSSGDVIGASMRYGRRAELIQRHLAAGEYFVTVVAQSYGQARYRLDIDANLVPAQPPLPDAPPVDAPPVDAPPVDAPPANPPSAAPPIDPAPVTPPAGAPTPPSTAPEPFADVPDFGGVREWNVNAVGAPEAWAAGYAGQGVVVAIVDTGIDLDHPDLMSNLFVNPGEIPGNGLDDDQNGYVDDVHGYDFANNDSVANDENGHGTHVAGTIAAANNGFGATGIAPQATVMPVRVLDRNGSGTDYDVANGIRYAAALGAQIINLSLGGGYSRAIASAIDYANSLGSLVVAASGNESATMPGYPARFSAAKSNVISVGAFNSSNVLAGFSNRVGNSGAVQIDAPGVGIYSTYINGRYGSLSGTSMAAPHVAGVAALALSANPKLTNVQLRDLLTAGTIVKATSSDSIGSVQASTTVAWAAAGLTAPPTGAASTNPVSAGVGISDVTRSARQPIAPRSLIIASQQLANSSRVNSAILDSEFVFRIGLLV